MALPNPAAGTVQNQIQYVPWNAKESIQTALKASILQMQKSITEKSPLLRMIPGAGLIRERAEIKKRELYERTGRDEQGRKLTKQELEDREKRRKDLGALAEMRDIIEDWNDNGVPTKPWKAKLGDEKPMVVPTSSPEEEARENRSWIARLLGFGNQVTPAPRETGAYDIMGDDESQSLQTEEQRAEQEREDDKDQLESEERQQNFFTKLFGRKSGDEKKKGLLDSLLGLIGPLISGGWAALMGAVITPILGALTSAMGAIVGFVGPLLAAIGPVLVAALPAILALMLGGAVGLMIANWIKGQADEREKKLWQETQKEMKTGAVRKEAQTSEGETIYEVEKDGKTEFKTAKELNLSEEEKSQLKTGDFIKRGDSTVRTSTYQVETQGGKETGNLAPNLSSNEILASEIAQGRMSREEASSMKEGDRQLLEVERQMQDYTSSFQKNIENSTDNSATALKLVNDFNAVATNMNNLARKYPDTFTSGKLKEFSNKYPLFGPLLWGGKVDMDKKAYIDKDAAFLGGDYDYMDADDLVIPGVGNFTFGEKVGNEFTTPFGGGKKVFGETYDRSAPVTKTPEISPPQPMGGNVTPSSGNMSAPQPTGMDIPQSSAENAALQQMPTPMPPISTNNNTVNQSNNSTIIGPISATRSTGVDASKPFNGIGAVALF